MRFFISGGLFCLVFFMPAGAKLCDATFYFQGGKLLTVEGNDVNNLAVTAETEISGLNDIAKLDTITYKVVYSYQSACKVLSGYPDVPSPVVYLTRQPQGEVFEKSSSDMIVRYYSEVTYNSLSLKHAMVIKPDTLSTTTDLILLDSIAGKYTAVYGAGNMLDELNDAIGNNRAYGYTLWHWDNFIDSTDFLTRIRESYWKDTPAEIYAADWPAQAPDDELVRNISIQILLAYYDTTEVTVSLNKAKVAEKGPAVSSAGRTISIQLPAGESGEQVLQVFSLSGSLVRTLHSSSQLFKWDGRSDRHAAMPAGVYLFNAGPWRGKLLLPARD